MITKLLKFFFVCTLLAVILPSCSKSSGTDVEYLAVKLSDSKSNWSIIELNSGKVIAREDFKNKPSVICDDMFYVQNDKGEYEFYNINDINKQIGDSYEHATHFQDERAIVKKKDEPLQIINTKGETVKKLGESVKAAKPFKNGFAAIVSEEGKAGFIDTEGNIVIKMEYDAAAEFSEDGYVVVGKKNEENMTYSVINAKGEKMFSFNSDKYSDVRTGFVGGSMAVVKDDKIVYLDSEGKQMMKVGENKGSNDDYGIYNGLTIFANDEGNFGVKNKDGEVVIKAKYDDLKPNRDGSFLASKDGKYAIVNGEGQQLSADEYKDIIRINPDRFIVKDGNSYSIIDKEGKEIGTETFSDYSYAFDDSPAVNEAREVSFSTDEISSSLTDFASLFREALQNQQNGVYTLTGTIANVGATLDIMIQDGQIYGSYYYHRYGPDHRLQLRGEINNGYLSMYETDEYGNTTGVFNGIIDGNIFSGTHTNIAKARDTQFSFVAEQLQ